MVFADRDDAGRQLAARLGYLRGEPVVVLGLPRGGVPVAFQVARALRRAAGCHRGAEARGALPARAGHGRGRRGWGAGPQPRGHPRGPGTGDPRSRQSWRGSGRGGGRAAGYRARRPRQRLDGRVAVVVDNGVATGSTARAACQITRALRAARVVLAVPVAPPGWQARIGATPTSWSASARSGDLPPSGSSTPGFPQVPDEEVLACLERAAVPPSPAQAEHPGRTANPPAREEEVRPEVGAVQLAGYLTVPDAPVDRGLRTRQRQQPAQPPQPATCASVLNDAGLGTLLFDLLTRRGGARPGERVRHRPARRAPGRGHRWLRAQPRRGSGCSRLLRRQHRRRGGAVGGGRARRRHLGHRVPRRPPRPGRPRLAGGDRADAADRRRARRGGARPQPPGPGELRCENDLAVVPGATHLFEEPGTLDMAAGLARDWFISHLTQ